MCGCNKRSGSVQRSGNTRPIIQPPRLPSVTRNLAAGPTPNIKAMSTSPTVSGKEFKNRQNVERIKRQEMARRILGR